jgi:fluoride ion exporter CrcB/FEX
MLSLLVQVTTISVFAMVGVSLRVGVDILASEIHMGSSASGTSFSSLLTNCIGCFLLGVISSLKSRFVQVNLLYLGVTTGLCGSMTTFSGWMYSASWVLTNEVDERDGFLSHFVDSLGVLVVGLSLPCVLMQFGQHIALLFGPHDSQAPAPAPAPSPSPSPSLTTPSITPAPSSSLSVVPLSASEASLSPSSLLSPFPPPPSLTPEMTPSAVSSPLFFTPYHVDVDSFDGAVDDVITQSDTPSLAEDMWKYLVIVFTTMSSQDVTQPLIHIVLVTLPFCILLPILFTVTSSQPVVLSILFAPVGALLRWRLSVSLNKTGQIPWGTFMANLLGTVLYCVVCVSMGVLTDGDNTVTPQNIVTSPSPSPPPPPPPPLSPTPLSPSPSPSISPSPSLLPSSAPSPSPVPYHAHAYSPYILWLFFEAILVGFCGSLTTMSTFVLEILSLSPSRMYAYLSLSILSAYFVLLVINGVYFWGEGGRSVVPLSHSNPSSTT